MKISTFSLSMTTAVLLSSTSFSEPPQRTENTPSTLTPTRKSPPAPPEKGGTSPSPEVSQARVVDALLKAEESTEVKSARKAYGEAREALENALKKATLREDPGLTDWWNSRENTSSARLREAEAWIPMGPFQREFMRRKIQSSRAVSTGSPTPAPSPVK
jgi:hypothetical protein